MPPPDGEGPAELLLRKAGDDLTVIEKMVDGKGYPVEIIGFHAQQCCEKAFTSDPRDLITQRIRRLVAAQEYPPSASISTRASGASSSFIVAARGPRGRRGGSRR